MPAGERGVCGPPSATLANTSYLIQFWTDKFSQNVARDHRNEDALKRLGWQVLVLWECETRNETAVQERLLNYLGSERGDASESVR